LFAGSYQDGGRLIIPECRPADGGQYVCTIYLANGERHVAFASLVVEGDDTGSGIVQREYNIAVLYFNNFLYLIPIYITNCRKLLMNLLNH